MKFFAAFLLIMSLTVPASAEQSLSFGYIHAPLSYSSLAVLKAAYAKIGIDVSGLKLPAARSLVQSDAGMTDGEVHRIKSIAQEHPQLIRIKVPINTVEGMALSCDNYIDTTDLNSLKDYRIGIKTGTRYAEKLTEEMPFITELPDENRLKELLLAKRLDVVIGDRPWAERQTEECLRINEPPLVVIPLYHYLHKSHADLVPKITDVLQKMANSGESKRIVKKTLKSIKNRQIPTE